MAAAAAPRCMQESTKPSEHGMRQVGLHGEVVAGGMISDRGAWLQGCNLLGFPCSRSMMLFWQQGVPWPSTMVPLEVVAFLLQGGELSGCHEAQFAMEKNPFPFRTLMVKVTVNLSPAFGAHRLYQSAGHHWITMYTTHFAVVGPL